MSHQSQKMENMMNPSQTGNRSENINPPTAAIIKTSTSKLVCPVDCVAVDVNVNTDANGTGESDLKSSCNNMEQRVIRKKNIFDRILHLDSLVWQSCSLYCAVGFLTLSTRYAILV